MILIFNTEYSTGSPILTFSDKAGMVLFAFTSSGRSISSTLNDNVPQDIKDAIRSTLKVKTFPIHSFSTEDFRTLYELDSIVTSLKPDNKAKKMGNNILGKLKKVGIRDNERIVIADSTGATIDDLTRLWFSCRNRNPIHTWCSINDISRSFNAKGFRHLLAMDIGEEYVIGDSNNRDKICRFCGCSESEGAIFRKDAHAISVFLGNKHLLSACECDRCNALFGNNGIEWDLERYYRPTRIDANVRGRGKNVEAIGENFVKTQTESRYYLADGEAEVLHKNITEGKAFPYALVDNQPVVKANVYRCLVKYVLSCLPEWNDDLFGDVAEWVIGNIKGGKLPPTYRYEKLDSPVMPVLEIFLGEKNCEDFPMCVARFHFLTNVWVYAVPYIHGERNNKLGRKLKNFVDEFCREQVYTVEDFSSETQSVILTHYTLELGKGSSIKYYKDMTPEERAEFDKHRPSDNKTVMISRKQ